MTRQVELDAPMEALCVELAAARAGGGTVAAPGFAFSLEQAYAMQARITGRLGSPRVGWKVGSTSEAAQARLGTREPGAGALIERFVHSSGASVPVWGAHDGRVEVEFAFRMAAALPPRAGPYTGDEVRAAIGAFIPALELVGSRFAAGLDGSGRNPVTADGGANIAFVGGVEREMPRDFDYRSQPCVLRINGREAAAGTGARALGDPVNVLVWLANHLSARGLGLAAGEIVTTGTCTGLVAVAAGDRLCGDFGDLGEVSAGIVAAAA